MTTEIARTSEKQPIRLPSWSVPDMMTAAEGIAGSVLLRGKTGGSPQEVIATTALLLLTARDMGLPPVASLPHMHVIDGSVTLSPHLLLALIQRAAGPQDKMSIDEGDGYCEVTMTRPGGLVASYTVRWDRARAQKARLASRPNWSTHEAAMLRVRAIGEAARVVWADVVHGLYCDGEIISDDWPPEQPAPAITEAPVDSEPAAGGDEPDPEAVALKERVQQALADWGEAHRADLVSRMRTKLASFRPTPIQRLNEAQQEDLLTFLEVLEHEFEVAAEASNADVS